MRRVMVAAGVLVALVVVAGCSGTVEETGGASTSGSGGPGSAPEHETVPDGESDVLTHAEMVVELEEYAATLTLPPGVEWPPPPPVPEPAPDAEGVMHETVYEPGVGKSIAGAYWWCAWSQEWLTQRGSDTAREAEALATLHEVRDNYYFETQDEATQRLTEEMLLAADLGDPTLIARNVDLNCNV
jgi:hypothetical protein